MRCPAKQTNLPWSFVKCQQSVIISRTLVESSTITAAGHEVAEDKKGSTLASHL
jgi:hypothetical protein